MIAAIEGGELLHQDRPSRTYLVGDEPVDFAHFGDGHRAKFRDLFATRRVVMPLHEPAPPLPTYLLPHL